MQYFPDLFREKKTCGEKVSRVARDTGVLVLPEVAD